LKAVIGQNLVEASEILISGGLVAVPTETVYGLAANALDPMAVAKIFEVKNRPFFDPLIVHCRNSEEAFRYAENISSLALKLARAFWPGPLTLVLKKRDPA
jgi:L-threonylcarbamoyladenylate synthase